MERNKERTEEATPKKLRDAKKKGEGPSYVETYKALAFLAMCCLLMAFSSLLFRQLKLFFEKSLSFQKASLLPLGMLVFALLVLFFLLNLLVRGKKRGASFLFQLGKLGVLVCITALFLLHAAPLSWQLLERFVQVSVSALVLLSLLEMGYQRWKWKKKMRMTKEEVKEEKKETEGNPHLKDKISRRKE